MKLRNKKTGEVIDLDIADIKAHFGGISVIPEPVKLEGVEYVYDSLAELNEEWEDYKPAEPLIADVEQRELARHWFEVSDLDWAYYLKRYDCLCAGDIDELSGNYSFMSLPKYSALKGLEEHKKYSKLELCGEGEE